MTDLGTRRAVPAATRFSPVRYGSEADIRQIILTF
jgi:hypothetical protein